MLREAFKEAGTLTANQSKVQQFALEQAWNILQAAKIVDSIREDPMIKAQEPVLLTVKEAAEKANLDPSRIRRLAKQGILPGVKRGHAWFLDPEQVTSYTRSNRGRQPKN